MMVNRCEVNVFEVNRCEVNVIEENRYGCEVNV